MKIITTNDIEFTEVQYSELYGKMRIDSQYYEPFYIKNSEKIALKPHKAIKEFMHAPQYGISIAMNENDNGFKILKMDDIINVLANDEKAKYAEISEKIFTQFKLKKYDVLFNRVNSDEYVGRTGIYLMDGEHTFASYLVRISSDLTYQNCYLTAYLNCKYGYHSLQRIKRRAVNQANINAQELKEIIVPYPSVGFQKKIEKLLTDSYTLKKDSVNNFKIATKLLLNEIELNTWQVNQVEFTIGNTNFYTDDTINQIKLSQTNVENRIDSEFWQIYLVELIDKIKKYKNGWASLGSICNIHDNNFAPDNYINYKYIELANIGLFGNVIGYTESQGKDLPTRARRLIRSGQVIVSSVEGSTASCALITASHNYSVCSTGFYVINSNEINSETLIVLLKSNPFQHLLKKGCNGTILSAINKRFFSAIPLPKVEKKIQDVIQMKVQEMYRMDEKSSKYIDIAKKAVEIYIEKDEKTSLKYISDNT